MPIGDILGDLSVVQVLVLAIVVIAVLSFLVGALLFYLPANPLPGKVYNGTYVSCGSGCTTSSGVFISAYNKTPAYAVYSFQVCQAFGSGQGACSNIYPLYIASSASSAGAANVNNNASVTLVASDVIVTNKQLSNCAAQNNCNPSQVAGLNAQLISQQTQKSILISAIKYNNALSATTTTALSTTATTTSTTSSGTTTGTTTSATTTVPPPPPPNPSIIGQILNPIIQWLNFTFGLSLGYFM